MKKLLAIVAAFGAAALVAATAQAGSSARTHARASGALVAYWPPLVSNGTPHAGTGVKQSLLTLARAHNGVRQVLYAGRPLYTFVGDKRAGQAAGEGLNNFGAGWYIVAASGRKVEANAGTSGIGPGYSNGY